MKIRLLGSFTLALSLLTGWAPAAWARPVGDVVGSITSLTVVGGANPGDTILISSTVLAKDKVEQSNLFYQVYAPDGVTIVATHQTDLVSLELGESFSHSWTTVNSSFPSAGNYTVHLCWSTGNASNCNIAQATTTFYSVPTLGWWLTILGLGLVGMWLWRQRESFPVRYA